MSTRVNAIAAACWCMCLFRELLRGALALQGVLELRPVFTNPFDFSDGLWPPYVDLWVYAAIPFEVFLVWFYWRQIEWKDRP